MTRRLWEIISAFFATPLTHSEGPSSLTVLHAGTAQNYLNLKNLDSFKVNSTELRRIDRTCGILWLLFYSFLKPHTSRYSWVTVLDVCARRCPSRSSKLERGWATATVYGFWAETKHALSLLEGLGLSLKRCHHLLLLVQCLTFLFWFLVCYWWTCSCRWHLQGWLLAIAVGICSSLSGAGLDVGVQGAGTGCDICDASRLPSRFDPDKAFHHYVLAFAVQIGWSHFGIVQRSAGSGCAAADVVDVALAIWSVSDRFSDRVFLP